MNNKEIYLRCDDHAEVVVFSKFNFEDDDIDYEITIEDAYCGYDFMGIKNRFKRAWHAFWARPICYNGVYCQDGKRIRKFLEDCLSLMDEDEKTKTKCKDCDYAVKDFFKCAPGEYVCIGVKEPFVISDINAECTQY
jgi:hypothetical protein